LEIAILQLERYLPVIFAIGKVFLASSIAGTHCMIWLCKGKLQDKNTA
jgi:hypothetical protein